MNKTIGIVGSRRRHRQVDFMAVKAALVEVYQDGDLLVSGGCPTGGDRFAERLARELGASILIHHARWRVNGKLDLKAGFKRNSFIARDSDILIACVAPDRTGGTEDTIEKYQARGGSRLVLV